MTRAELDALLARLGPDLTRLDAPWAIIGSAGLMLAGVDWPDCADLDILTTTAGAAWLEAAWSHRRDGVYAPDPQAPFRSRFSRYDMAPGAVEVMGDLEVRGAAGWRRLDVAELALMPGGPWPVPTREEQGRIFRLFGRPKDLAKAQVAQAGA
jgi:hypothetical protein